MIIEYSASEEREHLAKFLENKFDDFLNRYSPIRKYKFYKKNRMGKCKWAKHYELIGRITLIHAGIEQNLKANLISWGVCVENNKSGGLLRKFFLEELEKANCPQAHLKEYKVLIERFRVLGDTRNETVKALYEQDTDTLDILKFDRISHAKAFYRVGDSGKDLDFIMPLMNQSVTQEQLKTLLADLEKLSMDFHELESKNFLEKHKLHYSIFLEGKSGYIQIPEDAYSNPYKYAYLLKKQP